VFQEEVGAEGTPHLQGFVYNKNQVAMSTLKQWNLRLHLEPARCIKSSLAYCSDATKRAPGGRIWQSGFEIPDERATYLLEEGDMFAWQTELLAELRGPPDERRITWYCDDFGGSGKTAFCKFALATFPSALFFSGGNFRDISHSVCKSTRTPTVVIVNLPRSSEGKVSYGAIEAIKDGIIQSGKYEGGFRLFAPPHVVIMSNFMPQLDQLSMDRWDIRILANNRRLLPPAPM